MALMFIDDFSRLTVVMMTASKTQLLQILQDFKRDVADVIQITIKALWPDQGGEFTGAFFTEYCKKNGITLEFTARYWPYRNGMAKIPWRT